MRSNQSALRDFALPLLAAAGLFVVALSSQQCASAANEVQRVAVSPSKTRRPVSLRDRLVVGLQARLKSEVAFVEKVVQRVQTGQLPQRLVDQTFLWARDRAAASRGGRTRRPIIFFQPAMTARAKRLNVAL
jgi:hypothetical protein